MNTNLTKTYSSAIPESKKHTNTIYYPIDRDAVIIKGKDVADNKAVEELEETVETLELTVEGIKSSSKPYIIDANKMLSVIAGTTKTILDVPFLTMTQIDNLYTNFIAGKNCLIKWQPNGYDKVVSTGWVNGCNRVTIIHTDRSDNTSYNITYHYDGSWVNPRKVYLDGNGVIYKNDTDGYLINHITYSENV